MTDPVADAVVIANKTGGAGCAGMGLIIAIILVALGWAVVSPNAQRPNTIEVNGGAGSSAAAPVGPLPDVGVSGPATPPPAQAPVAAPAANPPSDASSSGQTDTGASQQPAQSQAPTPAPASQCALPGSIGVLGGNPSSLGGSGGTTTVASTPFSLSTPTLVNCGAHYRLAFSASGTSGTSSGNDCKTEGFDYDISAYVHVGDTVTVTLQLPPNDCG